MKKTTNAPKVPTAGIAVNKSRLKVYNKKGSLPTYYLTKGQEFQIELFNPTTDIVLAKIILNGKAIAQGGLVLKQGTRVFLDRYIDVAKKFLFDTYEVSNTEEVKEAIESNGDIKIEFYRQKEEILIQPNITWTNHNNDWNLNMPIGGNFYNANVGTTTDTAVSSSHLTGSNDMSFTTTTASLGNEVTLDTLSSPLRSSSLKKKTVKSKKTMETGRVEKGSYSDQKFNTVDYDFEYFPFHTIEYKMLPLSQKVNTVDDINVKRYCTSCGSKLGRTHKFCANCGTKG